MNAYMIKKTMIENAITRGIREMGNDPERSIRRIVDLGKQFSGNRFQDHVLSVMQELLDNEHSAYYDMVHNLFANTGEEAIKAFGVNFGYMSWAYGAGMIRRVEAEEEIRIPWSIRLRYDPANPSGPSIPDLARLIEEGQSLGIYAYFIRLAGSSTSYELLELLERYKDCAFVFIRENGTLTAAQIQVLKLLKNTLTSLPIEDPETLLTAELLRDQRLLFALHASYDDNTAESCLPKYMEGVIALQTPFFFLLRKDGTVLDATKACYDSRLEQRYPCVMMDYEGDGRAISKVLVEHDTLLEIGEDGTVLEPASRRGTPFPFDIPLKEALKSIMPPMKE